MQPTSPIDGSQTELKDPPNTPSLVSRAVSINAFDLLDSNDSALLR